MGTFFSTGATLGEGNFSNRSESNPEGITAVVTRRRKGKWSLLRHRSVDYPRGMGTSTDPTSVTFDDLVHRARALIRPGRRTILGIVGAPGSGKSTLAEAIARSLNPVIPDLDQMPLVATVPMDGFHLAQSELERLDRASRKGAIDTFDGWGFLSLVERLAAADHLVYAPEFWRELEEPIAGAIPVPPEVPLVILEGNYLLADKAPWHQIAPLLTESWFLVVDEEERQDRLITRHRQFGRTAQEARDHALGSDQQNAELIVTTAPRADLRVKIENW